MASPNSGISDEVNNKPFNRWKVIWPALLIVLSGFILVILAALGVELDSFMIK